jgi:hypothetical protein
MASTCTIKTCGRDAKANGLCSMHYMRQRRGLPLDAPLKRARIGPGFVLLRTRIESSCLQELEREARATRRTVYEVAAATLETWARRRKTKR